MEFCLPIIHFFLEIKDASVTLKIMPARVVLLVLVTTFFTLFASPVFADTSEQTCDMCGWCNKTIETTPPPNHAQCMACIYEADGTTPIPNSYYTVLGCLSTKPEFFVKSILNVVFGIAGGIAFLFVLWGSAQVLTSSGDPIRLENGKDLIISSLLGIFLIIFSVFILRMIGFDILKIPGFG